MSTRTVTVGIALAAVVVGAYLGSRTAPKLDPVPTRETVATTSMATLTVHVSGRVVEPGVVLVAEGALVADVIAAAGGALSDANLALINLSRPVVGGELIEVPGPNGEATVLGGNGPDMIPLNSADAEELTALPGVGAVLARRIVAYRETHGPFTTAEDLLDVSGIGEAKLASIRELIRVP